MDRRSNGRQEDPSHLVDHDFLKTLNADEASAYPNSILYRSDRGIFIPQFLPRFPQQNEHLDATENGNRCIHHPEKPASSAIPRSNAAAVSRDARNDVIQPRMLPTGRRHANEVNGARPTLRSGNSSGPSSYPRQQFGTGGRGSHSISQSDGVATHTKKGQTRASDDKEKINISIINDYKEKGLMCFENKQYLESVEMFTEAIENIRSHYHQAGKDKRRIQSKETELLKARARSFAQLQEWEKAEKDAKRALENDGNCVEALTVIQQVLLARHKYQELIAHLTRSYNNISHLNVAEREKVIACLLDLPIEPAKVSEALKALDKEVLLPDNLWKFAVKHLQEANRQEIMDDVIAYATKMQEKHCLRTLSIAQTATNTTSSSEVAETSTISAQSTAQVKETATDVRKKQRAQQPKDSREQSSKKTRAKTSSKKKDDTQKKSSEQKCLCSESLAKAEANKHVTNFDVQKARDILSDVLDRCEDVPEHVTKLSDTEYTKLVTMLQPKWKTVMKLVAAAVTEDNGQRCVARGVDLNSFLQTGKFDSEKKLNEYLCKFLEAGAKPKDLQVATQKKLYLCVLTLLKHGSNPRDFSVTEGDTPLHAALHAIINSNTSWEIFDHLLELYRRDNKEYKYLNPNSFDADGNTLLHKLAMKSIKDKCLNKKISDLLHKRIANLQINTEKRNKEGKLARDYLKNDNDVRMRYMKPPSANGSCHSMTSQNDHQTVKKDDEKRADLGEQKAAHPNPPRRDPRKDLLEKITNVVDRMGDVAEDKLDMFDAHVNREQDMRDIGLFRFDYVPRDDDSNLPDDDRLVNFDELEWEVECTANVWQTLLMVDSLNKPVFERLLKKHIINRFHLLASGMWLKELCQPAQEKGSLKKFRIGKLIVIWESAISFSARRSQAGSEKIYAEVIRIWDLVADEEEVEKSVSMIRDSKNRGTLSMAKKDLIITEGSKAGEVVGKSDRRFPALYKAKTEEEISDVTRWTPPASCKENEYHIMKFYPFNTDMAKYILENSDASVDFPFNVTETEHDYIHHNPHTPQTTLLLGRSGTGKTTCCLYSLFYQYLSTKNEVLAIEEPAAEERNRLRKVFVTKNPSLTQQVMKRFSYFCRPTSHPFIGPDPQKQRLGDISPDSFPLFLTSRKLLQLLDASLPDPFFERHPNGEMRQDIEGWGKNESTSKLVDTADDINQPEDNPRTRRRGQNYVPKEVTYEIFADKLWPKMKKVCRKNAEQFHPSLVWMEIVSFIKGSLKAVNSESGYLTLEEYREVGHKQVSYITGDRDDVYSLFEEYRKITRQDYYFDECDVIHHVYQRLMKSKSNEWAIHQVFVDEVQDFTQAELVLLVHACRDMNSMFFTGDTAQSIMRGVAFRFNDLVSLFHGIETSRQKKVEALKEGVRKKRKEERERKARAEETSDDGVEEANKEDREVDACQENGEEPSEQLTDEDIERLHEIVHVPKQVYQLTQNYRTHSGVIQLANSVIHLLKRFFPLSFDHADEDMALFDGPKPMIFDSQRLDDLIVALRGNKESGSEIEFGAHQTIIVPNQAAMDEIPQQFSECPLILTVFESKGLEFDDVLLYNFFKNSEANKEWRVLINYLNELADQDSTEGTNIRHRLDKLNAEDTARPLDFDHDAHKILNSELKQLYTAITRARVHVWIYDEDVEIRKPMFQYLRALDLVKVQSSDGGKKEERKKPRFNADWNRVGMSEDTGHGSTQTEDGFTKKSSTREWYVRGTELFKKKLWERAAKCFQKAEDTSMVQVCNAYECANKAKSLTNESARQNEYLNAALKFLECPLKAKSLTNESARQNEYLNAALKFLERPRLRDLLTGAAICLSEAKELELSGKVYKRIEKFVEAAKKYKSCWKRSHEQRHFNEAVELYRLGDHYDEAIRLLYDEKRYQEALEVLNMYDREVYKCSTEEGADPIRLVQLQNHCPHKDRASLTFLLADQKLLENEIHAYVDLMTSIGWSFKDIAAHLRRKGKMNSAAIVTEEYMGDPLEAAERYRAMNDYQSAISCLKRCKNLPKRQLADCYMILYKRHRKQLNKGDDSEQENQKENEEMIKLAEEYYKELKMDKKLGELYLVKAGTSNNVESALEQYRKAECDIGALQCMYQMFPNPPNEEQLRSYDIKQLGIKWLRKMRSVLNAIRSKSGSVYKDVHEFYGIDNGWVDKYADTRIAELEESIIDKIDVTTADEIIRKDLLDKLKNIFKAMVNIVNVGVSEYIPTEVRKCPEDCPKLHSSIELRKYRQLIHQMYQRLFVFGHIGELYIVDPSVRSIVDEILKDASYHIDQGIDELLENLTLRKHYSWQPNWFHIILEKAKSYDARWIMTFRADPRMYTDEEARKQVYCDSTLLLKLMYSTLLQGVFREKGRSNSPKLSVLLTKLEREANSKEQKMNWPGCTDMRKKQDSPNLFRFILESFNDHYNNNEPFSAMDKCNRYLSLIATRSLKTPSLSPSMDVLLPILELQFMRGLMLLLNSKRYTAFFPMAYLHNLNMFDYLCRGKIAQTEVIIVRYSIKNLQKFTEAVMGRLSNLCRIVFGVRCGNFNILEEAAAGDYDAQTIERIIIFSLIMLINVELVVNGTLIHTSNSSREERMLSLEEVILRGLDRWLVNVKTIPPMLRQLLTNVLKAGGLKAIVTHLKTYLDHSGQNDLMEGWFNKKPTGNDLIFQFRKAITHESMDDGFTNFDPSRESDEYKQFIKETADAKKQPTEITEQTPEEEEEDEKEVTLDAADQNQEPEQVTDELVNERECVICIDTRFNATLDDDRLEQMQKHIKSPEHQNIRKLYQKYKDELVIINNTVDRLSKDVDERMKEYEEEPEIQKTNVEFEEKIEMLQKIIKDMEQKKSWPWTGKLKTGLKDVEAIYHTILSKMKEKSKKTSK